MQRTLSPEDKRALDLMRKDNFRGISKDNVLQLISILDKVNPEVAKDLIAQMPEAIRGVIESEKTYANLLTTGIESIKSSTESCSETEDSIIQSLREQAEKDNTSFEEKKFYYEKMAEAAERKEMKDTENKKVILTILRHGREVLTLGLCVTACIFIGRADIKFPVPKRA